ncbi:MAG: YicC family protein [Phycisphaeraceae bacterium]|nr:YicC family protein [Phycisphaeraceae bacterium]
MTGFGDAAEKVDSVHYTVELRSLNNKYIKVTTRLPEELAGLEAELDAVIRKRVCRGSFTLTVTMQKPAAQATYQMNQESLGMYLDHLETIRSKLASTQQNLNVDLTVLLTLPGIMVTTKDHEDLVRNARQPVLSLTQKACDRLAKMRATEGQIIAIDLDSQRDALRQNIKTIKQRSPKVVEEYHQRLRARIDQLLARAELQINEPDLIREVAIFAERSDISEEISRLVGHLEQFDDIVQANDNEPTGRTLDFIAQEMLREANTIASKSNDGQISRAVVEVKAAIDRIKEQVQNIE